MNRQSSEFANGIPRLPGMDDVYGKGWERKNRLQERLIKLLASYGYRSVETPVLEPTELFMRKSGGELASQLYSFIDPGSNAVSLRPEFTAPIMRHYFERGVESPVRWQYCGPVFRSEGVGGGGQFTQIGGELIGPSNRLAAVELLGLAAAVASSAGVSDWKLQLADLDLLTNLLGPIELSERARDFVLQSVPRLREGKKSADVLFEEARRLHLAGQPSGLDHLSQAVEGLDDSQARVVLRGLLSWNASDNFGQRSPEDVVERLLRKVRKPDRDSEVRSALELAGALAQVHGRPGPALEAARAVFRGAGLDGSEVGPLSEVLELLSGQLDVDEHIVLDFGLARGPAYYNGIIFEVTHPGWPAPLGGGGRYDGLARALGYPWSPTALGFAYNLDALMAVTAASAESPSDTGPTGGALVTAAGSGGYLHALRAAQEIREQGGTAELDVSGHSLELAKSYAVNRGLKRVVWVHEDGQRTTHEMGQP